MIIISFQSLNNNVKVCVYCIIFCMFCLIYMVPTSLFAVTFVQLTLQLSLVIPQQFLLDQPTPTPSDDHISGSLAMQ